MTKFKDAFEFEKRKKESTSILKKHPDRVPVIVEIENGSTLSLRQKLPSLDKNKYLVPDIPFSSFLFIVRKRLTLSQEVAIFPYLKDGTLPIMTESVLSIYNKYKDEDGFLYITITGENFFG